MRDKAKEHYCRERVSNWLLDHGYSTGRGDTIEDLLDGLIDQVQDNTTNGIFYVPDGKFPL